MTTGRKPGRWTDSVELAGGVQKTTVLGVCYLHLRLENQGDLYVTEHGWPFVENLKPESFYTDEVWFRNNSERLSGTSTLYKVRTKEIGGRHKDIVLKWNRMGQEVPGAGEDEASAGAEFNSPFEEFSLVVELRNAARESPGKIITHKPLAIYVSPDHVEPSRTARKEYKMHAKIQAHKDVELDMYRPYAVIYEWIKGVDAVRACREGILEDEQIESLTLRSRKELRERGFLVKDSKPHHVIVRPKKTSGLARDREGRILYGLVDFELLARTREREEKVKKAKRLGYLERQRDRFLPRDTSQYPPHLTPANILEVSYVCGHAESTGGALWVVGNDPHLFDYFLPERWEKTPRTKLSIVNEIYHTLTKDNINLVWKVSNVGMQPDADPFKEDERRILEHGYNSPFEEVSLAVYLSRKGIPTTYPRAVYMAGSRTEISAKLSDRRRYETHRQYSAPDRTPVLREDRDYVTIWGYWNGPDEKLAARDADYYEAIDALRAHREGIITRDEYVALMRRERETLLGVGVEDLNLRGNHLLFSLRSSGSLVVDSQGVPEVRICSFELLRRIEKTDRPAGGV